MHFLCPYLPASFFLLAASNTFQLLLAMIIKSFPINLGHKIILFLDFTPRNSMPRSLSVLLTIHFISFLLINYATVYTWAFLKHCWWYLTRHLIHLQGDSSLVLVGIFVAYSMFRRSFALLSLCVSLRYFEENRKMGDCYKTFFHHFPFLFSISVFPYSNLVHHMRPPEPNPSANISTRRLWHIWMKEIILFLLWWIKIEMSK